MFNFLVLAAIGEGEQHAVLALGLHLPGHPVQLGVLQPHSLHYLEGGASVGQGGLGQVPVSRHIVHPDVGHVVLQAKGA